MLGTSTGSVTALLLLSLLKKLDKLSDRIEVEAIQSDDIWWRSEKDLYVQKR